MSAAGTFFGADGGGAWGDVYKRQVLVRGKDSDIGHILENVVYLELLRRGFQVRVGQMNDGEVDFVAMNSEETVYYQAVSYTHLAVSG